MTEIAKKRPNTEAAKESRRKWLERNRQKQEESHAAWVRDNSDKRKLWAARWYKENRASVLAHQAEYGKANPHIAREHSRRRKSALKLATPTWANTFFIGEIYDLAKLRTRLTGIKWHVDHVIPIDGKRVCGFHCETNLQVVPAVVNMAKGSNTWPDMP
jgi:uncharacterized protein involved in type VI secretion and phage assembly